MAEQTTQAPVHGRPAILRDVAQLAGVSIATASKALNGRDEVHPETRRRVVAAADNLSFTPNSLARGLLAGRTGVVGLVTSDLEGRFSIPILIGAEDAFGAGEVSVLLADARDDSIRERHHLAKLLARQVDGLILVGSRTDPRPSTGPQPVPTVYVYAPSDRPEDISLVPDNVGAGTMAVQHLVSMGRRRIAHISGDPLYAAAQDRAAGVTTALETAGLPLVGGQVMFGHWSEAWGRAATYVLLDQLTEIDAIICGSDQVARGCLDVLRERNVDVPGAVAVASFDNWKILAEQSRPPLTSIDMQFEGLGRLAAQRLLDVINGKSHSGMETVPCRLVIRESTVPRS